MCSESVLWPAGKMLKGVLRRQKNECLNWVTIAVKCEVVYEISTFWLENKKSETEKNIQLPECTAVAAFQGHTYCFLARTVISTVVEQQTTTNMILCFEQQFPKLNILSGVSSSLSPS